MENIFFLGKAYTLNFGGVALGGACGQPIEYDEWEAKLRAHLFSNRRYTKHKTIQLGHFHLKLLMHLT